MPANVKQLILTGTANTAAIGTNFANFIYGNSGKNWLDGKGGTDRIEGAEGDDIYIIDTVGDIVIENANGGWDTVRAGTDYSLSNNVEQLILTGSAHAAALGNYSNNFLYGNSGKNWIDGGTGVNRMEGAEGDDTYIVDNVGDIIIEGVNGGNDTVRSSVDYWLTDNIE